MLAAWLRDRDLPVHQWGTGTSKTVAHVLAELQQGECDLGLINGQLTRRVSVVLVDVFSTRGRLVEAYQQFRDGRQRTRELKASLSEKLKPDERPIDAARRALSEELGVTTQLALRRGRSETESKDSPRYPGLHATFLYARFNTTLPKGLVQDEYLERQADKTTVWRWQPRPRLAATRAVLIAAALIGLVIALLVALALLHIHAGA